MDYFNDIPFVKVETKEDILKEINKPINSLTNIGNDFEDFKNKFCLYDSPIASKEVLSVFLDGFEPCNRVRITRSQNLTLFYTGQFLRNGITTSFLNLLSNLDLDEIKVVCNFNQSTTKKESFETIYSLPNKVSYIPNNGRMLLTPIERVLMFFRLRGRFINKWTDLLERKIFEREAKRLYSNVTFDNVIHFTGYDRKACLLYSYMKGEKTIFVHNDMELELKNRNNYSPYAVLSAWKLFNNIAIVRESLYQSCINVLPEIGMKIKTVHNTVNFKYAKFMASQSLSDMVEPEIEDLLNDDATKKVITIGRFSSEKGHLRLIDAFESVASHDHKLHLYIMGGHGDLFNTTLKRAKNSLYSERIHLLVGIKNPYPILKKMDLFILSSYYEGLPMVFFESILMKVPIVSVDIQGPADFLNEGYGKVVANSTKGLEDAFHAIGSNNIEKVEENKLKRFNEKALSEYYSILK